MTLNLDPCKEHLAQSIFLALKTLPNFESFEFNQSDIYSLMEKPPEHTMGDYSLPCFRFAKTLKLPPPKIAEHIVHLLNSQPSPWILKAQVLNAFCNIFVKPEALAAYALPKALDESLFRYPMAPKESLDRVMVEYSQPNTHKEFHVGHMRNVCLGSSIVNIFRYCGYHATAANYFGDEGAHIAKCLWMMKKLNAKPSPSDEKGAWLGSLYTKACIELDQLTGDDLKSAEQEISLILKEIERKSGPTFELWKTTKEWSLNAFKEIYSWIGAEFDRDFFESEVSENSQAIVSDYLKSGVFKEDQGAIGIDLSDYKLGFMLLRKRDGNTLYGTKDLSLARRKFEEFKIDRNIYVVASEQNHHFKQVFKTLELMGFSQASKCFHLSYGMVVLPEGKMSSRLGNTVPFMVLKDKMLDEINKILAKYKDLWPEQEIKDTAHKLCVGAIKYGMLSADPAREIVFEMNDWLSFEGNTGPYLMYGYTRAMSILRKALEAGLAIDNIYETKMTFAESSEQELLRSIYDFNIIVKEACDQFRPSHLCTHLFYMAKTFSRFYADANILKEADSDIRSSRLVLTQGFARTLKTGLHLLGIEPPERM